MVENNPHIASRLELIERFFIKYYEGTVVPEFVQTKRDYYYQAASEYSGRKRVVLFEPSYWKDTSIFIRPESYSNGQFLDALILREDGYLYCRTVSKRISQIEYYEIAPIYESSGICGIDAFRAGRLIFIIQERATETVSDLWDRIEKRQSPLLQYALSLLDQATKDEAKAELANLYEEGLVIHEMGHILDEQSEQLIKLVALNDLLQDKPLNNYRKFLNETLAELQVLDHVLRGLPKNQKRYTALFLMKLDEYSIMASNPRDVKSQLTGTLLSRVALALDADQSLDIQKLGKTVDEIKAQLNILRNHFLQKLNDASPEEIGVFVINEQQQLLKYGSTMKDQ